jgi:ATP-dependent helicase HrpA
MTIKAFPALVDKKNTVAIELFESEQIAEQTMLVGVSRLVLLNIPSPIKYLQQKLPNKAKLGMYFNPFGSINELLEDCIQASCQYLVLKNNIVLPRDDESFKRCKDYVRAEIADCVLAAAIKVEKVLTLTHNIRKTMKGSVSLHVIQSHGDIKAQLEQLVFKGFVTVSGIEKLDDMIRYLNAILRRLEKLNIDPNQDRIKLIEVEKIADSLKNLLDKQHKGAPLPQEVADTRWMLEELRVSLFAQNLGTPYPISVKRIKNHLKSVT